MASFPCDPSASADWDWFDWVPRGLGSMGAGGRSTTKLGELTSGLILATRSRSEGFQPGSRFQTESKIPVRGLLGTENVASVPAPPVRALTRPAAAPSKREAPMRNSSECVYVSLQVTQMTCPSHVKGTTRSRTYPWHSDSEPCHVLENSRVVPQERTSHPASPKNELHILVSRFMFH